MNRNFVNQYDVIHHEINLENPLTVGNGDFAYTCDITGLQTFFANYQQIPLCTMTNLFWAHKPKEGECPYKTYVKASNGEVVKYMTDVTAKSYASYRDDSFKFDLFKLVFLYDNQPIQIQDIHSIYQRLSLFEGKIISDFTIQNEKVHVETKIPQLHHNLQIQVKTKLKKLSIQILFFEPSSNRFGRTDSPSKYQFNEDNSISIEHETVKYQLYYQTNMQHKDSLFLVEEESKLIISLTNDFKDDTDMEKYFLKAKQMDTQDEELNRRMVLSLYLHKVNTLGMYPPAETGLTCNSWYGKFHLEMHLWHHLGLIRFGLYEYVLPSLNWYLSLYDSSKKRAEEQGYMGIRFPKMTDDKGEDTPSNIGCLLIWQMPHLFVIIDEILKQNSKAIQFQKYLPLLVGLTDFMVSFFYKKDGKYHLDSPLIPANENVKFDCDTPIFEECYILHSFEIFKRWIAEYHMNYDTDKIDDILKNYVPLEIHEGCYEAYIGCIDTYTKLNYDHPMMIGMYSYFKSRIVDKQIISNTLNKILNCWTIDQTWGWDFPMLAMAANNLGKKDLAISILKMNAAKNQYLKNGHNPQYPKESLPLYLPGNGAFLLAISHIFGEDDE